MKENLGFTTTKRGSEGDEEKDEGIQNNEGDAGGGKKRSKYDDECSKERVGVAELADV